MLATTIMLKGTAAIWMGRLDGMDSGRLSSRLDIAILLELVADRYDD